MVMSQAARTGRQLKITQSICEAVLLAYCAEGIIFGEISDLR